MTLLVKFCVELSEKVPVAVNCCFVPLAIEGFAGVSAIDTSVAGVTVKVVDPVMPPETALIALVPVATPVANPPAVIVATPVVAELHVSRAGQILSGTIRKRSRRGELIDHAFGN